MKNVNGESRSRKWILVLIIIMLATIGTFIPPMIGTWIFDEPLVIISGAEWVSVISLIVAAYITGNVWQKKEEIKANTSIKLSASTSTKNKTREEGEH